MSGPAAGVLEWNGLPLQTSAQRALRRSGPAICP